LDALDENVIQLVVTAEDVGTLFGFAGAHAEGLQRLAADHDRGFEVFALDDFDAQ
jgi:hypothetical protein